jgi:hypothetical protein
VSSAYTISLGTHGKTCTNCISECRSSRWIFKRGATIGHLKGCVILNMGTVKRKWIEAIELTAEEEERMPPDPKRKRAIMQIDMNFMHAILKLPKTVEVRDAHVGLDDFGRNAFSLCLIGDGLPTPAIRDNERAPFVTAVYEETEDGYEFVAFTQP